MNTPEHCEYSPADFRAIVIETPHIRLIHVSGTGLCPSPGWKLELVAANPGIVPHPESLWLEIRETQPRVPGAYAPTESSLEAIIEDSRAEQVVIRFRKREGFVLPLREHVGARR